jgi:TrmH family RNA methyltransferase
MSFRSIESSSNPTFKVLLSYKKGEPKEGYFLVEGQDLVDEAKKEGLLVALIVPLNTHCPMVDYQIYGLKDNLYKELSSYQSLPVCMGLCRKKLNQDVGKRIIYLDRIQDPGNAGTMVRTALSFGYTGVVFSPDSVSLYNSKTIQATKGALFHLPIYRADLNDYALKGYHIYLTTLDGEDESQLDKLPEPFVLVFGNEGQGVRKEYQNLGKKLKIEMSGIDSLNVAVASGIFMYRFRSRNNGR